ncbi:MAG: hypothetical protein DMF80_10480 [Acidobacteria bacterium]|nr:MAG: hypothetical protein DMF80_10480 [Acidobacteriota bacterium]
MTFLAFGLRHGYKPAPVSLLELEGRRPDAVFEKQNDTLAKRHHVRIWRRPSLFRGRPVWLAAATHDVDITFLRKQRTFTHRVDPRIDLERGKIVDDLAFTGQVAAWGLIDRPPAPRDAATSTGDRIETDGRIAVVLFRP